MRPPLRVVKVGGSLLDWDELPAALKNWLTRQTPATNVLVSGGGRFADAIRRADESHALGEEASHWLCVDAMSLTARLLGKMAKLAVVTRAEDVPESAAACVFDPGQFLRELEPKLFAATLPHTWAVTSDSIAARLAEFLHADELVLLKSCLPEADTGIRSAAATGYVDEYFPIAAARLPRIRCVNLRSGPFEEVVWTKES